MRLKITSIYAFYLLAINLVFIVIATGVRPMTVGSDTLGYWQYYNELLLGNAHYFRFEYLFEFIGRGFAFFHSSSVFFFATFALINVITITILSQKIAVFFNCEVNFYRFFFLLSSSFFLLPFFFSIQVNVMRQGTSLLLLLLYSVMLLVEKRTVATILFTAVFAAGFHHSTIMYLVISPLLFLNYGLVLSSTLLASTIYMSGLGQCLIHTYSLSLYNKIVKFGVLSGYNSGIRYDFALFTLGVGFFFHLLNYFYSSKQDKKQFSNLLKIYWVLTIPFFLLGFGTYSDRYLLPSWIFISVLFSSFIGLYLKRYNWSIYWYYLLFSLSSVYFVLRTMDLYYWLSLK